MSDEDEAQCKIHEMTYSAHTETKALFWGEASSWANSESNRVESQASFLEDTIGDMTDRAGLLDKDKKDVGPKSGENEEPTN